MAKYSKKIVDKIIGLIKSDTYTIAEICRNVGITHTTYHQWIAVHEDFAKAVEEAKEEREQFFTLEAEKSLLKKIRGFEIIETRTVTVPSKDDSTKPRIKEQITTKKPIPPDVAAIIFALTNGDPKRWRNRQNTEVTGRDGADLLPSPNLGALSDEELLQYNALLEKINKGDGNTR